MNGTCHWTDLEAAVMTLRDCRDAVAKVGRVSQALGNGVTALNEATGMNLGSKEEADAVGPIALRRFQQEALKHIAVVRQRFGFVVELPADWPKPDATWAR